MLVQVNWCGEVKVRREIHHWNFVCLVDGMDMWEIARLAMLMVKRTVDRE